MRCGSRWSRSSAVEANRGSPNPADQGLPSLRACTCGVFVSRHISDPVRCATACGTCNWTRRRRGYSPQARVDRGWVADRVPGSPSISPASGSGPTWPLSAETGRPIRRELGPLPQHGGATEGQCRVCCVCLVMRPAGVAGQARRGPGGGTPPASLGRWWGRTGRSGGEDHVGAGRLDVVSTQRQPDHRRRPPPGPSASVRSRGASSAAHVPSAAA